MLLGEKLVRLDKDTAIHSEYYDRALQIAISKLRDAGELKLADFRDMLGVSRKYAMLLLDDFDKRRITKRSGEVRVAGEGFAFHT
jgi:selenocysteine-specific elongation factor